MFEVGFAELFLLGVIALLVVGPDRLPGLARTVGVWVGKAQRMVGQVRADIEREVRADEIRKAAKEYSPTSVLSDMRKEVEDFAGDVSKTVETDAAKPAPAATAEKKSPESKPSETTSEEATPAAATPEETKPADTQPEERESGADGPAAQTPVTAGAEGAAETGATAKTEGAPAPKATPDPESDAPVVAEPEAPEPPVDVDADAAGTTTEPEPGAPTPVSASGESLANGADEAPAPTEVTEAASSPPPERDERTATP